MNIASRRIHLRLYDKNHIIRQRADASTLLGIASGLDPGPGDE